MARFRVSVLFCELLLALPAGARQISIGVNTYSNRVGDASWEAAIEKLGADTVHLRFHPARASAGIDPVTANLEMLAGLVDLCRRHGWKLTLNMEDANWYAPMYPWGTYYPHDPLTNPPRDGYEYTIDWYHHDDGTYRFDIHDVFLKYLAGTGVFVGAVYDEPSHMQLGWNPYTRKWNPDSDAPCSGYWIDTDVFDNLQDAYDATLKACQTIRQHYSDYGFVLATEQVWPALFHLYARAGIIPGPKYLKEEWTPVIAMIAAGAAKQYGTPYWVSPDLWGANGFGKHWAAEYDSALKLAYWLGAETVYTEVLRLREDGCDRALVDWDYRLTDYGTALREFTTEYVPNHPRGYTHRDLQPEIAIIRFPDSCFDTGQAFLPDQLYGSKQIPVTATAEAWFAIWKLLTHDYVNLAGLTWHSGGYDPENHHFFCPLNSVSVYDHLAPAELLDEIRLFFLTGYTISPSTLAAVQDRVREGAWAVAMPHLAPPEVAPHFSGLEVEVPDGDGKWILTDDFQGSLSQAAAERFRGADDELRFLIADREVIFRPHGGDPDLMDITVMPFTNRARSDHGATATASSELDATRLDASSAIDGVTDAVSADSTWSTKGFSPPEWLTVDIGAPLTINRIVLYPRVWSECFPVDFRLEYGNDGTEWYVISSYEDYPTPPHDGTGVPEPQIFDFQPIRARYWKLTVTNTGVDDFDNQYVRLAEIAIGRAASD